MHVCKILPLGQLQFWEGARGQGGVFQKIIFFIFSTMKFNSTDLPSLGDFPVVALVGSRDTGIPVKTGAIAGQGTVPFFREMPTAFSELVDILKNIRVGGCT